MKGPCQETLVREHLLPSDHVELCLAVRSVVCLLDIDLLCVLLLFVGLIPAVGVSILNTDRSWSMRQVWLCTQDQIPEQDL